MRASYRLVFCLLLPLAARATPATDLARAELFALGPIGYAGVTSGGEKDFRRVLAELGASADLAWVAQNGRPAARFYALAGLHRINRAAYDRLKSTVIGLACPTMSGCLGRIMSGEEILREIEAGNFFRETTPPVVARPSVVVPPPREWLREARPFASPR